MAFKFKVDTFKNHASEIESTSESINEKSKTIKSLTIKTHNLDSDDIKTELSLGEYSETFESDDDASTMQSVSRGRKSSRKSVKNTNKYHSINESDENEYSDTFEELTNSHSSSSSSKSKSSSRKNSKPYTATKSYKYTDTFCTESSSSSDYESISLKTGKSLTIRELTKRIKHKLKYKHIEKKSNDGFNDESLKNLTEKLKDSLNKPKTDYTEKINRNYDEYSNIKINENLMKRLKLEKFIDEAKCEYDDKINNFGTDLVYNCFPEQQENLDLRKMRKELYFKNKCDLVKFKMISEKIDSHEIYYVDSLTLIGNLASELPKPTTNPNEIWRKLLEPLKNKTSTIEGTP
jgi:hypothetical protein